MDYLLYDLAGLPLQSYSNATLDTLRLPTKIVTPFLVMFLISLITRRTDSAALDRYYAKMKTPVDPDREKDEANLAASYRDPQQLESRRLFPGTQWEFQRPDRVDVLGFLLCVAACFGIIYLAIAVAAIGS